MLSWFSRFFYWIIPGTKHVGAWHTKNLWHIRRNFNQKVSGIKALNLYSTDPEVRLKLQLVALPKYMFIKSIFNSDEYLGKSKGISLVVTIFSAGAADWEILHYFFFSIDEQSWGGVIHCIKNMSTPLCNMYFLNNILWHIGSKQKYEMFCSFSLITFDRKW